MPMLPIIQHTPIPASIANHTVPTAETLLTVLPKQGHRIFTPTFPPHSIQNGGGKTTYSEGRLPNPPSSNSTHRPNNIGRTGLNGTAEPTTFSVMA